MINDRAPISQPLSSSNVAALQSIILEIAVDFVFYGVQVALFLAAAAALARKEGRAWILMMAIIALFISSTTGAAVDAILYPLQMPTFEVSPPDIKILFYRLYVTLAVSYRVNYLLSDAIVVWRAWVLWPHSRIARGLLSISMACSLSGAIVDGVWAVKSIWTGASAIRTLMITLPLLITNVFATVLVGIQVWIYRRDVRASLGPWSKRNGVEGVLMLLLESGLIYCAVWIVSLAINLLAPTNSFNAYGIVDKAFHTLAGIYPTFVVLAVSMQQRDASKSRTYNEGRNLPSLRFNSGSSPPPEDEEWAGTAITTHDLPGLLFSESESRPEDISLVARSQADRSC